METGRISLNGTWRLNLADRCSADAGETDCRVPGNVELDLIAAGLLPEDIFRGTNIKLAEKYETYDWTFSRRFDCPDPQKRYRIAFEGVDCLAAYYINGRKIGESDTMLVEHVFDLPVLKAKDNLLQVKIRSAFLENCERAYPVKLLLGNWGGELPEPAHLRRAAHTYGWDILPRAVSAGLWRGVYLEEVNPFAFKQFFLETKCLEDGCARLLVAYEFACFINRAKGYTLDISGVCGESAFHRTLPLYFKAGSAEFTLRNPRLWWQARFVRSGGKTSGRGRKLFKYAAYAIGHPDGKIEPHRHRARRKVRLYRQRYGNLCARDELDTVVALPFAGCGAAAPRAGVLKAEQIEHGTLLGRKCI